MTKAGEDGVKLLISTTVFHIYCFFVLLLISRSIMVTWAQLDLKHPMSWPLVTSMNACGYSSKTRVQGGICNEIVISCLSVTVFCKIKAIFRHFDRVQIPFAGVSTKQLEVHKAVILVKNDWSRACYGCNEGDCETGCHQHGRLKAFHSTYIEQTNHMLVTSDFQHLFYIYFSLYCVSIALRICQLGVFFVLFFFH